MERDGVVTADGRLQSLHRLGLPHKGEGVDVRVDAAGTALFMVTDADDSAQPS